MSANYSQNGAGIASIAKHCWACDLPVSYALQRCIELGFYRTFIKRYIEAIYEQQSTDFETWCSQFGSKS